MAFTDEHTLKLRARRAYELDRLRVGLFWGGVTGVPALFGAMVTGAVIWCASLGFVASTGAILFVWRGRALGAGVVPGITVGTLAMLIALASETCSTELAVNRSLCAACAGLGGFALGLAGARRRKEADALRGWASVVAVGTPLALIGCAGFGLGALGLGMGLMLGSVPALARLESAR